MVDIISNGHDWLIFLSVPLYCPYIAVQDQTIYVAGHASAAAEAHEQLQAYIYDVSSYQSVEAAAYPRSILWYSMYHQRKIIIGGHLFQCNE